MNFDKVIESTFWLTWRDENGEIISSRTSFLCQGYLITNNHVFAGPENCDVHFYKAGKEVVKLTHAAFKGRLKDGSAEENHDFAVLDMPELTVNVADPLAFGGPALLRIGAETIHAGFPFGRENICIHRGFVSSRFKSGPPDCIQIDGSVNYGNSGGPLIDVRSGLVVGVVTRKLNGLSEMFNEVRNSLRANIHQVQNAVGGMNINGFDPVAGFVISQNQLLHTMSEIERSANVGIGHAFSINELFQATCFQTSTVQS